MISFYYVKVGDFLKISKIKKTNSGKYNLILDNNEKITTYDEVILNNNLLYNNAIDSEMLNKINTDTKHYNIYNKVLKLIGIRLRSEKEIKDYLIKNNIEYDEINSILSKLKSIGLINDKSFTKAFILDKINFSNNGPSKIRQELQSHNIDGFIIDEELNNIDSSVYLEKIKKIIVKKVKANKKYSNYILKQKIIADLVNLGFYRDDINNCLSSIEFGNDNLIDNVYDKVYRNLCLRYEGNELYNKIKEKLYQKGFTLSEIEDVINRKSCL